METAHSVARKTAANESLCETHFMDVTSPFIGHELTRFLRPGLFRRDALLVLATRVATQEWRRPEARKDHVFSTIRTPAVHFFAADSRTSKRVSTAVTLAAGANVCATDIDQKS